MEKKIKELRKGDVFQTNFDNYALVCVENLNGHEFFISTIDTFKDVEIYGRGVYSISNSGYKFYPSDGEVTVHRNLLDEAERDLDKYDSLINKWQDEDLTEEEMTFIDTKILPYMFESEEPFSGLEIQYLMEYYDYEYGNIVEAGRHGWYSIEFIIHFHGIDYMTTIWVHDDYGNDTDHEVRFEKAELKEVTVQKWVRLREE